MVDLESVMHKLISPKYLISNWEIHLTIIRKTGIHRFWNFLSEPVKMHLIFSSLTKSPECLATPVTRWVHLLVDVREADLWEVDVANDPVHVSRR